MKKFILTVLIIAALAVSCSRGFYYTELGAYDPDADFERIVGSSYAYLTESLEPSAEEFLAVLNDSLIAAERIYISPALADGEQYYTYYRCDDVPSVTFFTASMERSDVSKVTPEEAECLWIREGVDRYQFINILSTTSVMLTADWAWIDFTPSFGGATQAFLVDGDYREEWREYWEKIASDCVKTSVENEDMQDVFWYGNESYNMAKERKSSIFTYHRVAEFYTQPFPVSIDYFGASRDDGYDI